MSEERGKRDSGTTGFDPGDAGSATGATPDDSSAVARPSGKRSARRSVGATRDSRGSESDNGAPAGNLRTARSATSVGDRPRQQPENIFKRLRRFFREVIAELRKVIWPNRKQLTTYTIVVVVFCAVLTAFIFGLDLAFVQGVRWLFG
ncbi:preprotein translocase subunit SecE [Rhodococcus chondri]|uniref:Protein translocase subunit SecE n=1 Tax=Rhodococcus chondri TaxID=3065941 RepID=A0ABU7JPI1_9NOCA|nr:preprotein translocase subunit SecE [Rhodococcus sp. CC-R104]MEE2031936.1 preprotein translocase subunit SecE [Rhodococcus sp. CC-R104]